MAKPAIPSPPIWKGVVPKQGKSVWSIEPGCTIVLIDAYSRIGLAVVIGSRMSIGSFKKAVFEAPSDIGNHTLVICAYPVCRVCDSAKTRIESSRRRTGTLNQIARKTVYVKAIRRITRVTVAPYLIERMGTLIPDTRNNRTKQTMFDSKSIVNRRRRS